jgi:hypothetical protein
LKERKFGLGQEKQRKRKFLVYAINAAYMFTENWDYIYSHVFERIKTIQRGNLIYVIVEPEEESKSPFFFVSIIDSTTGQTTKTFQILCRDNYDNIAYVGDKIFWTEEDTIKWSSIGKKDIKSASLKVKNGIFVLHEKKN